MPNGYGYDAFGTLNTELDNKFNNITEQDFTSNTKKLSKLDQQLRKMILSMGGIPEYIDSYLAEKFYYKSDDEADEDTEVMPELDDDNPDTWDEDAELYDVSDEDGDPSEISVQYAEKHTTSPFVTTGPSTDTLHDRITAASRRSSCSIVISQTTDGELYAFTPASAIIGKYRFNDKFSNMPKLAWRARVEGNALEEQLRRLQGIGDLLIRKIKTCSEFFEANTLGDAFSKLEDFTPDGILSDVLISADESVITELRKNVKISMPRFGVVALDTILDITKKALHSRISGIIKDEDRSKPKKQDEIVKELNYEVTRRRVSQILKKLGIPTRAGDRKRAYEEGNATWMG